MWMDADRDKDDGDDYDAPHELGAARDPDAYWRRRFFILGGGIVVVGLCVWLFPGGHQAAARTTATAKASMAALAKQGDLPAAAYGSAWPGQTLKETAKATATASAEGADHRTAGTGAHPSAGPSASPSPSPSPTLSASTTAAGRPRCAPSDVVLSLFTVQASYGPGALPTFDVYAVSTSAGACTFSYGAGSVQVVVTRHGRVVWDSAACKPPAAPPTRFTLGVPQELSFAWNRQAKEPSGCAGTLPAGAWGTFDAVAMTAGQSSPVRSFTLSR